MDQRRAVIRGILGGTAFGLGFVMGSPPEPAPTIPADQYGQLSKATQASLRAASHTERSSWGASLMVEEADLREQIDALVGPPTSWPEAPPEELTPEAFAAWPLQAFADALEVPPVQVDCESYPCMASFAMPMPADEDTFLDAVLIRNDLHRELGKERVVWTSDSGMHQDEDGNGWLLMSISLLPEEPSAALQQQVKVRSVLSHIAMRSANSLSPTQQ